MQSQLNNAGVVVIGRNEGERLRRCLRSVLKSNGQVVYVDSGSVDGSVATARSLDVDVVALDGSESFTAARARNAGFEQLVRRWAEVEYVQFVDGDCEIADRWMEKAVETMKTHPEVGVVWGRLRERFASASVYSRLCDMEWKRPVGETTSCGGNAMVRVDAFRQVGGYDTNLIAGEEPDLCYRARRKSWRIIHLGEEMAVHECGMTRFGQWWTRSLRSGHACAEGLALHGTARGWEKGRPVWSALAWGAGGLATGLVLLGASFWRPWLFFCVAVLTTLYLLLLLRIYRSRRRLHDPPRHAMLYAAFCLLGKIPQSLGVLSYWGYRMRGRRRDLVEYKSSTRPT